MEKQEFEDIIVKAIQAGKSETSGLVREVLGKIEESVGRQVDTKINGKLTDIKDHLKKQDEGMLKVVGKMDEMDKKMDDLKEKTLPAVESITFFKLLKKFVVWVAPLGVLAGIFKWIK